MLPNYFPGPIDQVRSTALGCEFKYLQQYAIELCGSLFVLQDLFVCIQKLMQYGSNCSDFLTFSFQSLHLLSCTNDLYQELNACHASAEGRESEVWGWHREK